jgi:beta-glucosidase
MSISRTRVVIATLMLSSTSVFAQAPATAPSASTSAQPWMNASIAPARRVALLLPQMTRAEKRQMVLGYFATDFPPRKFKAPAEARNGSAGPTPGASPRGEGRINPLSSRSPSNRLS